MRQLLSILLAIVISVGVVIALILLLMKPLGLDGARSVGDERSRLAVVGVKITF